MNTSDIKIPGVHNVENYMAAIAAVDGFVPEETIRQFARDFGGVEHRIELVRERNGVRFYNDSIASSPSRTIAGLRSFDQKVILIAGGYDKGVPFTQLGREICKKVKVLVLCGATAPAIRQAVDRGKRVIVEHFDLLYEALGFNADLIVGIGEEVIVTRPNVFGPLPDTIASIVHKSIRTRQMAHTAEDLCERHMNHEDYLRCEHADIKNGFLLTFPDTRPEIDIQRLEEQVLADIRADLPVEYADDGHVRIGGGIQPCTGPRTHVSSTGKIEGFRLLKKLIWDARSGRWLLVGRVGALRPDEVGSINNMDLE